MKKITGQKWRPLTVQSTRMPPSIVVVMKRWGVARVKVFHGVPFRPLAAIGQALRNP